MFRPALRADGRHIQRRAARCARANDEHAAALYTIRGERAGKQQLNDNQVQIFHIRDGKASEVWAQATDLYTLDEFFS